MDKKPRLRVKSSSAVRVERPAREPRDYGENRQENYSDESRKPRSYSSERPRRPYNSDRPDRPHHSDRPDRPYNSDRPDRPARPYNSDRPARPYSGSSDKPRRSYNNREEGDRPARPYNSDRPARPYRSSSDKPRRSYNNREEGDRPARKPYQGASDKPRRPYNKREEGDRPQRPYRSRSYEPAKKAAPARKQAVEEGTIRLNKFIANSGLCSRREADTFISAGLVSVNGTICSELGIRIKESDDIRVNGQRIKGEPKTYLVMNKPKGYVTTMSDDHAEKTVMELITGQCEQRVYPVGRLDKATMGVLLFTNDGELTEQLTHPSYNHKKIYQARLDKNLKKPDMDQLVAGVELEDGPMQVDMISYIDGDEREIGLEIHSGRNRVVRRLFEALGYKVQKLDRVYFAGLTKKNLKRGQWRFLSPEEINMLKTGFYD